MYHGDCTEEIVKKYNMIKCRTATTPLDPNFNVSNEDAPITEEERKLMINVPYREHIGSLLFLALYTRPDILFAATKLSQYNSNPEKQHWQQAKHVLRYLSATRDHGIVYKTGYQSMYCDTLRCRLGGRCGRSAFLFGDGNVIRR